jgi:two-component system, NarL family, nitrate/nitrite response regulator NarL
MGNRIRIGVVDDDPIFRIGVVHALQASTNLDLVAEGATTHDALRMAADNKLDILLLAIELRGNSVEIARAIRHTGSKVRVVILTSSDDAKRATDAIRVGVQGYILKNVSGADLICAIDSIHRGETQITPALAWHLMTRSPAPLPNSKMQ